MVSAGPASAAGQELRDDNVQFPDAVPYFEVQDAGWCGMHALNHYFGGPFVQRNDCISAAQQLARKTSERESDHLYPVSGWLSIETMNILAATRPGLGKHIQEGAREWRTLQAEVGVEAMVNWNQTHWTVLKHNSVTQTWLHINSCLGPARRHGRAQGLRAADVEQILAEIRRSAGGASLHRAFFIGVGWVGWIDRDG